MSGTPAQMAPPFAPNAALFLDIDGTLLEIASTPQAVHPGRADTKLIAALYEKTDGALAPGERPLARQDR